MEVAGGSEIQTQTQLIEGEEKGKQVVQRPIIFRRLILNIPRISSSAEAKKKLVYVSEGIPRKPGLNWVALDPYGDMEVKKEAVPEMRFPPGLDQLHSYRCCVVSKKVYFIGGTCKETENETNSVFIFDLETKKWEDGKPMQIARSCPVVVPIGNKIYVFGTYVGADYCEEDDLTIEEWAECYDTDADADAEDKEWKFLPHPPPPSLVKARYLKYHAVIEGRRLIILWAATGRVYFYNYRTGDWTQEENMPEGPDYNYNIATYGDFLLWHYYGKIYAYDFIWKKRFLIFTLPDSKFGKGPICGADVPEPTFLVSTSLTKLCLIWHEYYADKKLRCYTFNLQPTKPFIHGSLPFRISLNHRASFYTHGSGVEHALVVPA